jgi:predicted SnoaL-like aldol condensation-catalyzing enzyme
VDSKGAEDGVAKNSLIVEHWDVIETIPPADEFAHDNGKF